MHINVIVLLPKSDIHEPRIRWFHKANATIENLVDSGKILSDGIYPGWDWKDLTDPMIPEKVCDASTGIFTETVTPYVHKIVTPDGDVKDVPWSRPGWATIGGDPDPRVDYYGHPYIVFDLHV